MATFVYNDTRTLSSGVTLFSVASGDDYLLGRDTFWVASIFGARILTLAGINDLKMSGEFYANREVVFSTAGSNFVSITATGILAAADASAITLAGGSNHVLNAGDISGLTGIVLGGGSSGVVNSGTIFGNSDAVRFLTNTGLGESLANSGTIVSTTDDGVEFGVEGIRTVTNSGLIQALRSTAVNDLSSLVTSTLTLTNTGTIVGLEAIFGSAGIDTIVNSGAITGTVRLRSGDDLYDTGLGITNGRVFGENGDDTLVGSAIGDRLDGGSDNDVLTGNAGDDQLTGGLGADDLDGGAGSDTATYTAGIIADLVDPSRNTGEAAGDFYVSIENLVGSTAPDQLFGDAGRNRLRGNAGDDVLDGRGGGDVLIGGAGSDQYVVDDARDRIVELVGEGVDTVRAAISFTLGRDFENLTLTGTAALTGMGNAENNTITGNTGANIIDGLFGNDLLNGGAGIDQFRFTTALDAATAVDDILDFVPGSDRIGVSRTIFTTVGGSVAGMQAGAFVSGTAAGDANDRIIHNSATGEIFYDPDGTGALAQTLFARVGDGLVLTAADIFVFG